MSHREILEKTGLSPSAVWNGLKRCWDDGFVLRTKTAIYETEKVFRGRKGSVSTTRPYHLYLKKSGGLDSVRVDGFDFVSFSKEYLDPRGGGSKSKASRIRDFIQNNSSKAYFSIEIAEKLVEHGVKIGDIMITVHAIGDGGIEATLNAYEDTLVKNPREDHRHRIEHCEILTDEQILRIKRLGVIPSVQPNFAGEWGYPGGMYEQRLGTERLKMNNTYRRFLDEGIRIAFGSDCGYCPPWPMNPLYGLWVAVRHPIEGSGISLEEAVKGYTLDAAYSSFEEEIKGSLEPGKLADIAILSQDLTAIDPDEIKDVTVDLTMVGGKIEYRAKG